MTERLRTAASPLALPPDFARYGLTAVEVHQRQLQGLRNNVPLKSSRSTASILRENFLSITNLILFGIMLALLSVGKPGDAFMTGGVVTINVILGVAQELHAKRQLDQIALLARPKVSVLRGGVEQQIDPDEVVLGDALLVRPGDQIVVDGRIISEQPVHLDESLLTGESDAVPKYPGDEVLSGSYCLSGSGVYLAERVGRESFINQLSASAREYRHELTPLQYESSILVRLVVVVASILAILLFLSFALKESPVDQVVEAMAVVISLIPQGLLLIITVSYALGALRIARRGALIQQINAVESLSHVDVLCLDKTGTLTTTAINLCEIAPIGLDEVDLRQRLGDFVASTGQINHTAEAIARACPGRAYAPTAQVTFSSDYKWSGAAFNSDTPLRGSYVLGAPEMLIPHIPGGSGLEQAIQEWTEEGLRVLLFAHSPEMLEPPQDGTPPPIPAPLTPLGWLTFCEELRPDAQAVLDQFRAAGVQLKLISGDHPRTVAALARFAGLSDNLEVVSGLDLNGIPEGAFADMVAQAAVFGRITPDQKRQIVKTLREQGHYVAMIGDGVNDILSLKQANLGIAMESGSPATRSVADIVLLGDQFAVLPQAILEGQRILNAMQDIMRLFLTRTLYATLLILTAGFLGGNFPFTPKTNYLLTSLPVGFPAALLTIWARPGRPRQNLLFSVSDFIWPAGFCTTLATMGVYLLYNDESLQLQRTMLTTTAILCGMMLIIFAQYSAAEWRQGRLARPDLRRVVLAVALLALYALVFVVPFVRRFFGLTVLDGHDLLVAAGAALIWAVTVPLLWHFDVLRRILIPSRED